MLESLAGKLLVASPALDDPNFFKTVILICAHDADSALGVVLNRPLAAQADELVPEWSEGVSPPPIVFHGGPVEPRAALGLGRVHSDVEPSWVLPIPGGLGLLDLGAGPDEFDGELDGLRIFAGHAGWGGRQLEGELAEEAWFVVNAAANDAFDPDPARLWSRVLRRQGGELAIYASFPDDPTLN
jgi:putative transcriptional regulator